VHFFHPVPRKYLHSVEHCDIMQFSSSNSMVCLNMRIAGAQCIFKFETKQGEDMCVALQTHKNEKMMKHNTRIRHVSNGAIKNTGKAIKLYMKPYSVEVYRKHVLEMSELLEASQERIDEMAKDMRGKEKREMELQEELVCFKDRLQLEQKKLMGAINYRENLHRLSEERDSELKMRTVIQNM
ncbi:hypothetical protein KI387_035842, partial [Taxus chinensis]